MLTSSTDRLSEWSASAEPMPRQVWRSKSGSYRLILTTSGPTSALNRVSPLDGSPDLPLGTCWVLECKDGEDTLGGQRWRVVDSNGEPSRWRDVFRELAAERGLFA